MGGGRQISFQVSEEESEAGRLAEAVGFQPLVTHTLPQLATAPLSSPAQRSLQDKILLLSWSWNRLFSSAERSLSVSLSLVEGGAVTTTDHGRCRRRRLLAAVRQ